MSSSVEILNIPNFYSSYYLLGLYQNCRLVYRPEVRFSKFNNRGFVIFRIGQKIAIIDNHDPVGVDQELYEICDLYFATNKLLEHPSYNQDKVRPIFPHYPVNIISIYLRIFGLDLVRKLPLKALAKELYVLRSRPIYQELKDLYQFGNYVFFSGSTWKKEPWANQIRAEFIRNCKMNSRIEFEGGFIPRSDGNNFGYDDEVNTIKYSPKKFSELSAKSLISLNNPAVLGAVSWRLAEYWNASSFVLSFPFAIDLPVFPKNGSEIHLMDDAIQYAETIELILDNPEYHRKVAKGGNAFFRKYCTPKAQILYVIDKLSQI